MFKMTKKIKVIIDKLKLLKLRSENKLVGINNSKKEIKNPEPKNSDLQLLLNFDWRRIPNPTFCGLMRIIVFIAKYDTNKDGKLDTQERSKVSVEDRKKMWDLGLGRPRGVPKPPLNKPDAPKH